MKAKQRTRKPIGTTETQEMTAYERTGHTWQMKRTDMNGELKGMEAT